MSTEAKEKQAKKFTTKSLILTVLFGIVVAGALGGAIYYFMQYQNTQALLKDPQKATAEKSKLLVEEVGKLMVLPQGEAPQVATVSDVNKLKQQSFFAQAKNGDIVLIYTQAKKAILYDPVQKKLVEVGPINLADTAPSTAAMPSSAATPSQLRVALYNGTKVTGLSSTTERELKGKISTVTVVEKANAVKSTYTKTIVVDLTGKQAVGASQIAQALGGEVGSLPAGETKPSNADIAVYLGR